MYVLIHFYNKPIPLLISHPIKMAGSIVFPYENTCFIGKQYLQKDCLSKAQADYPTLAIIKL